MPLLLAEAKLRSNDIQSIQIEPNDPQLSLSADFSVHMEAPKESCAWKENEGERTRDIELNTQ